MIYDVIYSSAVLIEKLAFFKKTVVRVHHFILKLHDFFWIRYDAYESLKSKTTINCKVCISRYTLVLDPVK